MNGELLPGTIEEKYSRLDILLKVRGRKINIEMQIRSTRDYADRVLFYAAKVFTKDFEKGTSYNKLDQTISINVLDYVMFDAPQCHSTFMLRESQRNEVLTDKLRIDFPELPKTDSDSSMQVKRLRKWMKFLNINSEEDADMLAQTDDKLLIKAIHSLRKMSEDEKKQEMARIRDKALHDEASYLATARAEGVEEGFANMIQMMRLSGMSEDTINNVLAQRENLQYTPA